MPLENRPGSVLRTSATPSSSGCPLPPSLGVLHRTFEIVDNREQILEDRPRWRTSPSRLLPCSPLLQVFEVGALTLPPLLVAAGLFPGGLQLGFERLDPGLRGGT